MVWTKRYTGNGNSQYLEIWTGAVSASPGTTATFAFTGSNKQAAETFELTGVSALTAASAISTVTGGTASALITLAGAPTTAGDLVIWAVSANAPSGSYSGLNQAYTPGLSQFGGQVRFGITRAQANLSLSLWSISSSTVNYFAALVTVS